MVKNMEEEEEGGHHAIESQEHKNMINKILEKNNYL